MPQISVIVPVYNSEKYLPQCIGSILQQTFQDFELLLIDDGSTDHSGDICEQYAMKDSRVRVFHQDNQGASAARNTGIDQVRCEWLCFIDSDDYVDKDYLAAFFTQGCLEEDCLNMQGRNIISDIDGRIIESHSYPDLLADSRNMQEVFCHNNFLSNSGPVEKLFNKKLLDRISLRFRHDLTVREDAMFVYTYRAHMKRVKLISVTGYYYRQAFLRKSLCSKNHHYHVFLSVKEDLPPIILQVLKNWNLLETKQARHILSYYKDKTCLSILKSLYAYDTTRRQRLSALHKTFDDKTYFCDPCFQISNLLRMFYFLWLICPAGCFDALCYVPFRFYYKFIKRQPLIPDGREKRKIPLPASR